MLTRTSRSLSRARVGGVIDAFDTSVEGYVLRIDDGINKTAAEIASWKAGVLTQVAKRAASKDPSFPGCAIGGDVKLCLTPEEKAGSDFIDNEWDPFARRWKTYAAQNALFWNREEIDAFSAELTKKRTAFTVLTGRTFKYELPTPPEGGDKGSLGRVTDSLNNIVIIAGVGIAIYVGLTFIAPALLGAAARTKAARRSYNEA